MREQWKIAPSSGVISTRAIGALELLPIGYSHIISRVGPRSRKTFIPLATLVFCALVFAFSGEEAQAQQLPQEQQQHAVVDGQATEKVAKTPVEAAPVEETSLRGARQVKTPPAGPTPSPVPGPVPGLPAGLPAQPAQPAPDPAAVGPELPIESTLPADTESVSGPALLPEPISESMTATAEQDGPEAPVAPSLMPPASEPVTGLALPGDDAGPRPEPASRLAPAPPGDQETAPRPVDSHRSPLAFEPELVVGEESEFISLLAGEAPAAEPAVPGSGEEEGFYSSLSALETSAAGAVETLENATANALGTLVDGAHSWSVAAEGEGLIDTALTGLFSGGGEADPSPASKPDQESGSSSTGTGSESPLKDAAPQPVSPFTPPAGSSFSLSGGQVGPGGVVLLLLCVLASGLILLRRDFKLLWAFCELPKPSSALRLPLERPG